MMMGGMPQQQQQPQMAMMQGNPGYMGMYGMQPQMQQVCSHYRISHLNYQRCIIWLVLHNKLTIHQAAVSW
jgi:hypothetical protein